jgi:hypothetical protein
MSKIYRTAAHYLPENPLTDKCIYLDLDNTLLYTTDDEDDFVYLNKLNILTDPSLIDLRNRMYHIVMEDLETPGEGSKYEMWGITRPHLHEFLLFCFSYFRLVIVFSAGARLYIEPIIDHIFMDLPYPDAVLSRDETYEEKVGTIKLLSKVQNANALTQEYVRPENTFGLDDLESTFSKNKGNGILIPAYRPAYKEEKKGKRKEIPTIELFSKDDTALLKLKEWLMRPEVMSSTDVRTLDKSKIFK